MGCSKVGREFTPGHDFHSSHDSLKSWCFRGDSWGPTPFACKSLFLDLNIAKIITLQFWVKHICIFRTRVQTHCSPRGFCKKCICQSLAWRFLWYLDVGVVDRLAPSWNSVVQFIFPPFVTILQLWNYHLHNYSNTSWNTLNPCYDLAHCPCQFVYVLVWWHVGIMCSFSFEILYVDGYK